MKDPLVIYIIGDNRSGTTLLDYLLSWHPEALSVGEMHNLNGFFFKTSPKNFHNWACSCGEFVNECPFWLSILDKVSFSQAFSTQIKMGSFIEPRSSYFFSGLHKKNTEVAIKKYDTIENGKQVAANCWTLYKRIFKETGKSIIVDSSKNAYQAYFLNKYKEGNIHFLLMERDVEAVAYSKLNRAAKAYSGKERSIYSYIVSSRKILRKNRIIAEMILKENNGGSSNVTKIDYMRLTETPADIVNGIFSSLDKPTFDVPSQTNETRNEQIHTVGGSPSRFKQRRIEPDMRYNAYYKENLGVRLFKAFFK